MTDALFVVRSKFFRQIRLTGSIWRKIQEDHPEFNGRDEYIDAIKQAIEDPDYIVRGRLGGLITLSWCEAAPVRPKYIAVVYRELNSDGFVITAFFISRFRRLLARGILWRKTS